MNDQWTNRLSEYLDGELATDERAALEAHLGACAACRATLAELRQVVTRAQSLENREPAKDLWAGIAQAIRHKRLPERQDRRDRPVRRRLSLTVPQLLAASIALVLLSGGGVWMFRKPAPTTSVTQTPAPGTPIQAVSWVSQTDMAVADLQDALARNESRLDTATVRVVRQNLAVIDRAIAEARAALQRDPSSTYLNLHLANTMRRKVELLRRINALVTES